MRPFKLDRGVQDHVRDIVARLQFVPTAASANDGGAIPGWLAGELADLLSARHSLGYRPNRTVDGSWEHVDVVSPTLSADLLNRYHAETRRIPTTFHYDALHPDRPQRNRVRVRDELCSAHRSVGVEECVVERVWPRVGLGGWDQIRVLICEGDTLLAWVGALRPEPFGARERAALRAITPPLVRYLGAERRLLDAGLARAGLAAALDALGAPAFVVGIGGNVFHANTAGRALMDRWGPRQSRETLVAVVAGRHGVEASVMRLPLVDGPRTFLAILRGAERDDAHSLERVAVGWCATPREIDVLRGVVRGDANKEIAIRIGTSEGTVERHITSLLRKARCDSRARLIARYWALAAAGGR